MKKYTLYIGLLDAKLRTQLFSNDEAIYIIQQIILKYAGGATMSESTGIYTHDDGGIVFEPTIKIEIIFTEKEKIHCIAQEAREIFNQESILIEEIDCNSTYFKG